MNWYEDDIMRLEKERLELTYKPETIFYGSSSIRMWAGLKEDFPGLNPANLGFGGSTLAACTWYFDRVMTGYEPQKLIFYAGDNDLGDGRHPEEVCIFFQELTQRVTQHFGALPCYFISLKPSISRWHLVEQFKYANELISKEIKDKHPNWQWIDIFSKMLNADGQPNKEYYAEDGLHMTRKGYLVWKAAIEEAVAHS
ncbi:SGNH/GDSL hydrolase family protein [Mucilaginibacter sp. KACC 22063]|uniref:SGNH/GDSL hydrolase family protein n=1 Tax=Mucilaginibacter sp. KACC 22063 TaxID=3025666 RepID=UPI002366BDBC|nr:SGNH/GDSL hydrolase family protein [Mucilaginibacter sp. KACC 22063]WDF54864.1 SGNH/GDSL hydrolase family protein [Mucilaginibacter sp. KACC 22063]